MNTVFGRSTLVRESCRSTSIDCIRDEEGFDESHRRRWEIREASSLNWAGKAVCGKNDASCRRLFYDAVKAKSKTPRPRALFDLVGSRTLICTRGQKTRKHNYRAMRVKMLWKFSERKMEYNWQCCCIFKNWREKSILLSRTLFEVSDLVTPCAFAFDELRVYTMNFRLRHTAPPTSTDTVFHIEIYKRQEVDKIYNAGSISSFPRRVRLKLYASESWPQKYPLFREWKRPILWKWYLLYKSSFVTSTGTKHRLPTSVWTSLPN